MHKKSLLVFSSICIIVCLLLFICLPACKKSPTTPNAEILNRPVIWADSFEISFTAAANGNNPEPQVLKIKNSGKQVLDYTLTTDADWMEVIEKSGTSSGEVREHTVHIDKSGLEPQDEAYSGLITVTCSDAFNNPQKIAVDLILSKEPPPLIKVTPGKLKFSTQVGSNPLPKEISIQNTGEGTLRFEVKPDVNWISVDPKSGTSLLEIKNISVAVKAKEMAVGSYTGKIRISDPAAGNSPQEVEVTLQITAEPPSKIQVDPSSQTFQAITGETPPTQFLIISNSGGGTLKYSIQPQANWLAVSPDSGTSDGREKKHTVSVNSSGLAQGTYSTSILVSDPSASNSPVSIGVTLSLSDKPKPLITVSPAAMAFQTITGETPPTQFLIVSNSGGGTLKYSIQPQANWLAVSPDSGTSDGMEKKHTVSVNSSGLAQGTYSTSILVSDPSASNSPVSIGVTLTLSDKPEPLITVRPAAMAFQANLGLNPSPKTMFVGNGGTATLSYTISKNRSWISVSPTSGSTAGPERAHTVSINSQNLSQGTYSAEVLVSDPVAGNNPVSMSVALTVLPPLSDNKIGISISPSSGGTGTTISVPISITGNTNVIEVFGVRMSYNTSMFQFLGVSKSNLTSDWLAVDGNAVSGTVTIGGFAGSGAAIPLGSLGNIAVATFRVTCTSCSDGQTSQITIHSLTDNVAGMTISPGTVVFTYRN